jgi:hypothetical protein
VGDESYGLRNMARDESESAASELQEGRYELFLATDFAQRNRDGVIAELGDYEKVNIFLRNFSGAEQAEYEFVLDAYSLL